MQYPEWKNKNLNEKEKYFINSCLYFNYCQMKISDSILISKHCQFYTNILMVRKKICNLQKEAANFYILPAHKKWTEYKERKKKCDKSTILTRISWPIQANDSWWKTPQRTENTMQKGVTASVRYDTAPKKGAFTNVCPACWNHLKL